jgi:primosomal protein N' (replication factor Y)
MTDYCDVALAVPLRRAFTYAIPAALEEAITPGCRVLVPFGQRALVGVVLRRGSAAPAQGKVREVTQVLDAVPALSTALLELGGWLANYYVAPIGEVFRAMLPPPVEIQQRREVQLTSAGRQALEELRGLESPRAGQRAEIAVLEFLDKAGKPVAETRLGKLPEQHAAVLRLVHRGALEARETARARARRMQTIVAWRETYLSPSMSAAEERLREVLTAERGPVPLTVLLKLAEASRSVVERLEREGKVQTWEEPLVAEEEAFETNFSPPNHRLNPSQQAALNEIEQWLAARAFQTGLLYGVTGSGKTEVYLRATQRVLEAGGSVLILVPEIALTLWTSRLCRAQFGNVVAVLHSALADRERSREWWRIRRGEARVAVGTRSAVFAPLERLALVIVDEEHESSYKQEETPRYHGRDAAIVRARLERAVALLGSATPSLETFHHAQTGKYKLLQMEARVENRPMARVEIVDMREDFRRTHHAGPLSQKLREELAARLAEPSQSLVLLNRRGYSWFVLCRSCGAGVQCENCSISLTYHKRRNQLICHYCGFTRSVPRLCPKCESKHLYYVGEGTEQIEEHLRKLFPQARIGRLDRDAVRTKREYQQVLGAFAGGALDILAGTQMVAKGHDFQRVTLVGVVSADLLLGMPDFRAAERTFQLLTQVAGRAGRGELPGEVLVQTHYPEHYAIQHAAQQDYLSFFEKEIHFRRLMSYPPFTALASVIVRDAKVENAIRWSRILSSWLMPMVRKGIKVLGPAPAPLARIKKEYRFQFLLKSPKRGVLSGVLAGALEYCAKRKVPETAVLVDVDPLSLL